MERREDSNQDKAIAVMATDIGYIKKAIEKIDARLELMDGHFIKRDEVNNIKLEADKLHAEHEKRLREIETNFAVEKQASAVFQAQVKTWGSVAIIASGIIQFIIGKFF